MNLHDSQRLEVLNKIGLRFIRKIEKFAATWRKIGDSDHEFAPDPVLGKLLLEAAEVLTEWDALCEGVEEMEDKE